MSLLHSNSRTFFDYKRFHCLLSKFERFKFTSISYKELRSKISAIEKWFDSKHCLRLGHNDTTSVLFWKHISSQEMVISEVYHDQNESYDEQNDKDVDNSDNDNHEDDIDRLSDGVGDMGVRDHLNPFPPRITDSDSSDAEDFDLKAFLE
jgi:hypothetical protein